MGDYESRREDYKREAWEDAHPMEREGTCQRNNCGGELRLVLTTTYGDDADGRRGVPLRVYECSVCGDEVEVVYS